MIRGIRQVCGDSVVLMGRSAAWAWGSQLAGPTAAVEVNVPRDHQRRHRRELLVHQCALGPWEIANSPYGPATTPLRTALDLACRPGREWAVAALDDLLSVTGLTPAQVAEAAAAVSGRRGIRQARAVAQLLDPRAESPRESLLRVRMVDFGLPQPTSQLVVRDDRGGFLARLDFGWEEERVGVEYDGAHHREAQTHSGDLRRHNLLRAHGWSVFQLDFNGLADADRTLAAIRRLLLERRTGR